MKPTRKTYLLLATAAAQAFLAAAASAQIAAGQDGRAMDANNRVGSGGLNQPSGYIGVTPNQIIYGNVTGGKEFRGPVGSRDPGAFTGPSAGRLVDRFVAGSAGVPTAYQPQVDLTTAQPFYGMSRNAPPPSAAYASVTPAPTSEPTPPATTTASTPSTPPQKTTSPSTSASPTSSEHAPPSSEPAPLADQNSGTPSVCAPKRWVTPFQRLR